jgi:hypothetical protein
MSCAPRRLARAASLGGALAYLLRSRFSPAGFSPRARSHATALARVSLMLDAGEVIRTELRLAGYAPR